MKLAITGHTKGIGASLKAIFEKHGCSVLGFSKSTGYDIGNADTRKHILDSTFDIDLFVNNAYHPTGQLELLKGLINLWEGQEKYIINISSKIVYIESDYFPEDVKEYKQAKAELKKFTDEYKGSVIYSYYSEDYKNREFGVWNKWEKELNKRGWYSEWYDAGTVCIWPL